MKSGFQVLEPGRRVKDAETASGGFGRLAQTKGLGRPGLFQGANQNGVESGAAAGGQGQGQGVAELLFVVAIQQRGDEDHVVLHPRTRNRIEGGRQCVHQNAVSDLAAQSSSAGTRSAAAGRLIPRLPSAISSDTWSAVVEAGREVQASISA